MILLGRDFLQEFAARHGEAKKPLETWERLVRENDFIHFPQLRQTFAAADYVRPNTVFDVGGNKYRIIALVNYAKKTVLVKRVLTHQDYERRRI